MQSLRKFPMFWLYVASYTIVHAIFEYKFWVTGGGAIFDKYQPVLLDADAIPIAERVYYTKATWFFVLVWMQVLGARFKTALTWSFLLYSVELLLFFPFRIYTLLNIALAAGMVIEYFVRRKEPGW